MKKLILIFGTFAIICVIISSVTQVNSSVNTEATSQTEKADEKADIYTIKSENGRIVVYENDTLWQRTSTRVNTLPKIDQKLLLYGISASSKQEVQKILEDYCS
ncbi:MAG: hypothetical protein IIX27_05600 [Ruminococcus sp.]|nr:hypothetical protein [Ruminococcus sp.]